MDCLAAVTHAQSNLGPAVALGALLLVLALAGPAAGSTYVAFVPLDSPIYDEVAALDSLGVLDTYLPAIRPIARVEAARLVLEAERNLREREEVDADTALVRATIDALREQLDEEIEWLEDDREDNPPRLIARPLDRIEAQYVFSRGPRRQMQTPGGAVGIQAVEGTPLWPDNDALPTSPGSNEIVRLGGWAGALGFISAYGEGAVSGPITRATGGPWNSNSGRVEWVNGEVVASLGNLAVSFGRGEMAWGVGHYGSLAQGANATPFPALRVQNVHPTRLPGILRYLGPFRFQAFLGQLEGERQFAHPWIDGQIVAFKPLPDFEFGLTHAIMFGGRGNDNYNFLGFLGRASGVSTGSVALGNTNSRAGGYFRLRIPSLRGLELYQELIGEDNLTDELPKVGRFVPFIAVSFLGGAYLPRVTQDGRTDFRLEYAILEPNYSTHSDSLYWTNYDTVMGHPMGPNSSRVDLKLGRWFGNRYKFLVGLSYTERAPWMLTRTSVGANKERSGGINFELRCLPLRWQQGAGAMTELRVRAALEVVDNMNFTARTSVRALVLISIGIAPDWRGLTWQ
jgi:hypothetical protein